MYEQQFNWLDRLREIFIVDNKQFVFIIMRKISIQNQGSTYIIIWNSKTIIHNFSFYALLGCQSDINTSLRSAIECEIALTAPYLPSLKIFATKRRKTTFRTRCSMKLHTQQAHFSSQNYWGSKEEIYFMQKPYQQNSGMTWVSIPWTVGLPKWEGRSSYEKVTFLGNARISVLPPCKSFGQIIPFFIFNFSF